MDAFLGEIRMFGFNYAPAGWAFCNGQLLSIQQNAALFALLGTQYGGNGTTNFPLPDLRGRFPMHFGQGPGLTDKLMGERLGSPTTSVQTTNLPQHSHPFSLNASSGLATQVSPAGGVLAAGLGTGEARFAAETGDVTAMNTGVAGGSQPLSVQNPYLVVNFCIALQGIFPSRP